jgi:hypothetical protein
MDFTIDFIVVRDVATAAGLSGFGFFLGPFVYPSFSSTFCFPPSASFGRSLGSSAKGFSSDLADVATGRSAAWPRWHGNVFQATADRFDRDDSIEFPSPL